MRALRIILALPLLLVGGYLALVSVLVGCSNIAASGPAEGSFFLLTGMPTSLGEMITGAIGMVLIGLGYAIATGGGR